MLYGVNHPQLFRGVPIPRISGVSTTYLGARRRRVIENAIQYEEGKVNDEEEEKCGGRNDGCQLPPTAEIPVPVRDSASYHVRLAFNYVTAIFGRHRLLLAWTSSSCVTTSHDHEPEPAIYRPKNQEEGDRAATFVSWCVGAILIRIWRPLFKCTCIPLSNTS